MKKSERIKPVEPWKPIINSDQLYGSGTEWHQRINEKMKEIIDTVNKLVDERNQS